MGEWHRKKELVAGTADRELTRALLLGALLFLLAVDFNWFGEFLLAGKI